MLNICINIIINTPVTVPANQFSNNVMSLSWNKMLWSSQKSAQVQITRLPIMLVDNRSPARYILQMGKNAHWWISVLFRFFAVTNSKSSALVQFYCAVSSVRLLCGF